MLLPDATNFFNYIIDRPQQMWCSSKKLTERERAPIQLGLGAIHTLTAVNGRGNPGAVDFAHSSSSSSSDLS